MDSLRAQLARQVKQVLPLIRRGTRGTRDLVQETRFTELADKLLYSDETGFVPVRGEPSGSDAAVAPLGASVAFSPTQVAVSTNSSAKPPSLQTHTLAREELWDQLEALLRTYVCEGTYTRTNLAPDAPRDASGKLKDPLPSDMITARSKGIGRRIFDICKRMNPGFLFNAVQVNKFVSHLQCQMHKDIRNLGPSRVAILGDCVGGALKLADGRMFQRNRKWYQYNGALAEHGVMPF